MFRAGIKPATRSAAVDCSATAPTMLSAVCLFDTQFFKTTGWKGISAPKCFCQCRGNHSGEITRTWQLGQLKEYTGFLVSRSLTLSSVPPWAEGVIWWFSLYPRKKHPNAEMPLRRRNNDRSNTELANWPYPTTSRRETRGPYLPEIVYKRIGGYVQDAELGRAWH